MAARSRPQPASFCPPLLPESAADAAASGRRPWVLVDRKAYIAKRENATTARAASSGGATVEVSFCLADPPALSYLCVDCLDLDPEGRCKDGPFSTEPVVASAAGAFVLLLVRFNFGRRAFFYESGIRDYFVYQAGPGTPSLRCLPDPFPRDIKPWEAGILPCGGCGDGKEHFVVAALIPLLNPHTRPEMPFDLHLFSSRTWEWSTVVPELDPSCENRDRVFSHETSKVIVLAGGFLGWVDLWRGILLCNVLAEHPVVSFISLPKPMVAKAWKSCPGLIRDVTSNNNLLSFVEIQFPKTQYDDFPASYWDMCISDSDTDSDSDSDAMGCISNSWKATTWRRMLFTYNSKWRKDCDVGSADIVHGDPTCFRTLPELWDAETENLTLKNLSSSAPFLTMHDDGVVYMISTLNNTNDQEAWVAAFDLRQNTLKALVPCSAERMISFDDTCCPCTFSSYLGKTAGEEPAGSVANSIRREKLHE